MKVTHIFLVVMIFLVGCTQSQNSAIQIDSSTSQDEVAIKSVTDKCFKTQPISKFLSLGLQEIPFDEYSHAILSNEIDRTTWQQQIDLFPPEVEQQGMPTFLGFNRTDSRVAYIPNKVNPVSLNSTPLEANFLIMNGRHDTFNLRILFFIDGIPMQLNTPSSLQPYYQFDQFAPQETRALKLSLPALPEGIHQFQWMVYPYMAPEQDDSTERILQQIFTDVEMKELWVGSQVIPANAHVVKDIKLGSKLESFWTMTDVILEHLSPTNEPLEKASTIAGDRWCFPLRLWGAGDMDLPKGTLIPTRLLVLWGDEQPQVVDIDLMPAETTDVLLEVKVPDEPGQYQMIVLSFPFVGYSMFDETGMDWRMIPFLNASRRVQITVTP